MVVYTIGSLLKEGVFLLRHSECPSFYLDAELLLCHILNIERIEIIKDRDKILDDNVAKDFFRLIDERKKGKPIQYITGHQEFMGIDFCVHDKVLIPRPDTETLVEKVLELLKNVEKPKIADVCTGSGAIAVSLAHYIPDAFVYAADISLEAIMCCSKNIEKHQLEHRMKLLRGDLLEPLFEEGLEGKLDALVSNPPYISKKDMDGLPASVRCFEPHLALYGGREGLDFYVRILKDAARLLKKGGLLAFEIGYDQSDALTRIIQGHGVFKNVRTEKDLAGLDRIVYCYLEE